MLLKRQKTSRSNWEFQLSSGASETNLILSENENQINCVEILKQAEKNYLQPKPHPFIIIYDIGILDEKALTKTHFAAMGRTNDIAVLPW
jgi:hypothetical protein